MRPIELRELSPDAVEELANLYRTTHNIRLRARAQIVFLAAEQHMVTADMAKIVRTDEQTVRGWLKRYQAEGVAGLSDTPRGDLWLSTMPLDQFLKPLPFGVCQMDGRQFRI